MARLQRLWGPGCALDKNRTKGKQKARKAQTPGTKPGRGRPASKKRAATQKVETRDELVKVKFDKAEDDGGDD